MHPGDHTSYLILIVDILHELRNTFSRCHNALADHLIGKPAALVERLDDCLSITRDISELLLTIKMLTACHKPKLVISDL